MKTRLPVLAAAVLLGLSVSELGAQGAPPAGAPAGRGGGRGGAQQPMGFFITSVGKGDGANLGGLAGADAHCQQLAAAVSPAAGQRTWRAYLSTTAAGGQPAVNARDRIGEGP